MEPYERLSNYVEPDKARAEVAELKQVLLSKTAHESDRQGAWGPTVTYATDGTPRVRVHLLDEDAYMGYIEDTAYVGIAFMADEMLIEAYYPHRSDKLHVFYSYNELTGVTVRHQETTASQGQDSLPMAPGKEESDDNLKSIISYMRKITRDFVMTYEWNYQNEKRQVGKEPFVFELEQLS